MSYFSLSVCTMCVIFWIIPKFWFADKKGNVKSDAGLPNGCSPFMFVLTDCKDSLHPALKQNYSGSSNYSHHPWKKGFHNLYLQIQNVHDIVKSTYISEIIVHSSINKNIMKMNFFKIKIYTYSITWKYTIRYVLSLFIAHWIFFSFRRALMFFVRDNHFFINQCEKNPCEEKLLLM